MILIGFILLFYFKQYLDNEVLKDLSNNISKLVRVTKFVAKEVVIQHRLRMDRWRSSKRTKKDSEKFKTALVSYYDRADPLSNDVKCMILDTFFPRHQVIAGHIWKHETAGEGLEEFGLAVGDLDNPRNGILMSEGFESAFDVKRVCLLIDRIHSQNIVVKVLDPLLLPEFVTPSTTITFGNIDGQSIYHPVDKLPFRRILDFHAKCSFRVAAANGWITHNDTVESFFDMSIGASIPDLHVYQDLFEDENEDEHP